MCQDNDIKAIHEHLKQYPDDFLQQDFDLRSCVHILAKGGHVETLKALIGDSHKHKRMVLKKDGYGRTPLDEASDNHHYNTAQYLHEIEKEWI